MVLFRYCNVTLGRFLSEEFPFTSQRCAEFSWFFVVCVLLVILLWRTIFQNRKNTKLNISRPIYFKNISAQRFEDLICSNKLEGFYSRWLKSFFRDCKTSHLGVIFFAPKIILYFFQVSLFNFDAMLKTYFKNLFRKTMKKRVI